MARNHLASRQINAYKNNNSTQLSLSHLDTRGERIYCIRIAIQRDHHLSTHVSLIAQATESFLDLSHKLKKHSNLMLELYRLIINRYLLMSTSERYPPDAVKLDIALTYTIALLHVDLEAKLRLRLIRVKAKD